MPFNSPLASFMRRSKQNNWAFIFAFDSINQSNAHPKRLIPPFNLIKHQRQCCIHQIQYIFVCSIHSDQNSEQTSAVTPLSKAVFAEFGISSNWSCRTCQKSCIGSNIVLQAKAVDALWIEMDKIGIFWALNRSRTHNVQQIGCSNVYWWLQNGDANQ